MRPKSREELLTLAAENYEKLNQLIESVPIEQREATFDFDEAFLEKKKETHWRRDQTIKDVLIHLYEWHCLLLKWVTHNQLDEAISFIPEPYNWRTIPEMNRGFTKKHKSTTLEQATDWFKNSHEEVMRLVQSFDNDQLFQKNQYPWVGNTTLGSYFVSSTSSHYDWAIKKIKQSQKQKQKTKAVNAEKEQKK
ncbi:ClbS/DfsB family four-helix bundle protein [Enterococcus sp. DIV1298c]|uniref:ClbS/DfsB family four-helix bundle protein n=1 Tax=Candidatus Enterococcus mangumiae TaxID=2230878 RepID=A0ABZ2SYU2_9ENTE|nr:MULTISPECIES: ClbS/DfsB family four-helix bundle protein [unclassified Enterococcus]MBO0460468.1 ClbS/DfsB family four-helix bundle protein [Enterococcus sp. DIV1298c]MBO0490695.1 ClbS/DfsB family four-helix bundle protein [Enterococcus sp. DIV1094]